jgi:hypothetical protein
MRMRDSHCANGPCATVVRFQVGLVALLGMHNAT